MEEVTYKDLGEIYAKSKEFIAFLDKEFKDIEAIKGEK